MRLDAGKAACVAYGRLNTMSAHYTASRRTVGDGAAQRLDVVVGDALRIRQHLGHVLRDAHLRA